MSSPHEFDPLTDFCRYCGVPAYAVVDGMVSDICGSAPAPPSLNHGGPGVCGLCHPSATVRADRKVGQQSELQL